MVRKFQFQGSVQPAAGAPSRGAAWLADFIIAHLFIRTCCKKKFVVVVVFLHHFLRRCDTTSCTIFLLLLLKKDTSVELVFFLSWFFLSLLHRLNLGWFFEPKEANSCEYNYLLLLMKSTIITVCTPLQLPLHIRFSYRVKWKISKW